IGDADAGSRSHAEVHRHLTAQLQVGLAEVGELDELPRRQIATSAPHDIDDFFRIELAGVDHGPEVALDERPGAVRRELQSLVGLILGIIVAGVAASVHFVVPGFKTSHTRLNLRWSAAVSLETKQCCNLRLRLWRRGTM